MLIVAAFTVASLAGCMVGPNYHKPAVQTPAAFSELLLRTPKHKRRSHRMGIFPGGKPSMIRDCRNSFARGSSRITICGLARRAHQLCSRPTRCRTVQVVFLKWRAMAISTAARIGPRRQTAIFLTLTADAAFQLDLFGKTAARDRSFARGTAGNRRR